MKKLIIIYFFLIGFSSFSQQEFNKIDTTLKKIYTTLDEVQASLETINENVSKLKGKFIEDGSSPFSGQSIFEDKKGASAIFLPYGGTIRLNTSDASLKFSFIESVSDRSLFYGFDAGGKTNDGLMPFIKNGDISPGAKINGIMGFQELFHKSNILDGWVTFKVGYEGASFKIFSPDSAFSDQVQKVSFNTLNTMLSLNMKIGGNKILAASIGFEKTNNYDDLNEVELTDLFTVNDTSLYIIRTYKQTTKARMGNFETFKQVPINLDFYWYPVNLQRIGFYHYWRTKFTNSKINNGFGSGFYYLKKKKPFTSIAGIVFEIEDFSKIKDGFGKNLAINFIVGFNFGLSK